VVRRGGETVVFGWEEWWEVGDVWEEERLRVVSLVLAFTWLDGN
jgi:hypothetical protein